MGQRGGKFKPNRLPYRCHSTSGRFAIMLESLTFQTSDAIRPEFKPQPQDVVITKQRASVFFGTPLIAHLTQLGVQTLIICGESTSGCVRATAVDAYSLGFHVVLVEECCFDRSLLSHKVNLFDLHHKYADVMKIDEVVAHLDAMAVRKAS